MGCKGANGLGNADSEPERPSGSACGIRMTEFDPRRALEQGAEGVFGLRNAEIDPAATFGKAPGLRKP